MMSLAILLGAPVQPHIRLINSLSEVQEELYNAPDNVLVVFDLDETLIAPSNEIFYIRFRPIEDFDLTEIDFVTQIKSRLTQLSRDLHNPDFLERITSAAFASSTFTPVEESAVEIVRTLQKKNIKVIALTSSPSGRCFYVNNMKKWRYANLREIGLDLSTSFAIPDFQLEGLIQSFGSYPAFYKGILCAAFNPKGPVLEAFLKKINWTPSKIIFFDDSHENCKSVADTMNKLGIDIQCYWYRAAYTKKIKLDRHTTTCHINALIDRELSGLNHKAFNH
jgi:FMN phosphatase YigB (HAD superfamily)